MHHNVTHYVLLWLVEYPKILWLVGFQKLWLLIFKKLFLNKHFLLTCWGNASYNCTFKCTWHNYQKLTKLKKETKHLIICICIYVLNLIDTFEDINLMSSFKNLYFPTSLWNLWPQFLTQVSINWMKKKRKEKTLFRILLPVFWI